MLILKHCLIVSFELKFMKLVRDFFKFLSKISIKSIIDIKKYKPPNHCVDDRHNNKLSSKCLRLLNIVSKVMVGPFGAIRDERHVNPFVVVGHHRMHMTGLLRSLEKSVL